MISFHNPNFYEKIIKKYSRRIRKSLFPILFFKQDFKSLVQGNPCILFSTKLNFYNTLLRKNFSLNSYKEKQPGYSVFVPVFKFSGLNPPEFVREKSISLKLKLKKNEPSNPIKRLIRPGFLSLNFIPPEPKTSGFSSFNTIPSRLVNHKIKTCSLQSSNLKLFDTAALNYTYFNNSFANPTSPKLKFFMLKFFENNSWMPFIKIGDLFIISGFKILQNCKNLFIKENSLSFLHSKLSTVNETTFREAPYAADHSAIPLIYTPEASNFSQSIRSEALRKIDYLKLSGRTRTGSIRIPKMNFTPSVRFLKNFLEKKAFFLYRKYLAVSKSDTTGRNTTHERQKIVFLEPVVNIFKQQTGIIVQPRAGTYERILSTSVLKQIRSFQTVLKLSSFFKLRSDSINQKVREFNWLTALTYNSAGISQLNRQGTSTAGNTVAYQFNLQKSYKPENAKPENAVFAPYFHDMIQPTKEALDYAKIYIFSSAFRYLEFQKPASKFAHMTSNLAVDYHLSDSYVAYYHTIHSQNFDSKRELKREEKFNFEINRPQSMLHHHLFLKPPGITVSIVKIPEAILCSSGMNNIQKIRLNGGSLAHPPALTIAASSISRKIPNEILRRVEKLKLSSFGVLFRGVSVKKSNSEITGYKTFDKLLEILVGSYYPQNLNKEPRIRKTTGKDIQISKYPFLGRPEMVEKYNQIEKKAEQKPEELTTSISIQNTNLSPQHTKLSPAVLFLIPNFLEKTALFLYREYLSVTERNEMSLKTAYKQKKGLLQFSKKRIKQLLPIDGMISAKKVISEKKVSGKLSKSQLILQKVFLQRDVPAFPYINIHKIYNLSPFIGNLLLINKNGILSTESASSGYVNIFQDKKSKYFTNFYENISKEKIHFYSQFWLQKIFELFKLPVLLRTASMTDGENKAHSLRMQATREYNSTDIYIPEQPVYHLSDHQIVDSYTVSSQKAEYKREPKMKKRCLVQIKRLNSKLIKPFFVKSMETITYRLKRTKSLLYSNTQIFTSSDASIPIHGLQNLHIFSFLQIPPLSIKLSIPSQTGKYPDTAALSYPTNSTQKDPEDLAFNYIKTYAFEYSATLMRNLKVSAINYLAMHSSIVGKLLHSSATLKKDHLERRTILEKKTILEKRTLQALSGLSHSVLKKTIPHLFSRAFLSRNILKLFKTTYSPFGTNESVAIEKFITLNNKQNFISKGTFSSNSLFSDISSNTSVPLLSETSGTAFGKKYVPFFNLMKHTDPMIFQSLVFAEKPVSSSNKEARSSNAGVQENKTAFLSRFDVMPELNEKSAQHWKAARMKPMLCSGKRGYGNARDFLQRGSANFLKRENNSWQVNKKRDVDVAQRIVQQVSSDFVLSTMPGFATEMKWKKIFYSIRGPEKKPEGKKAVSKSILFRSRDLQSFKNSSKIGVDPGSRNTYFTPLSLKGESGTSSDTAAFRTSRKERSELMHAEGSMHKIGREDLVYGTSEPLFEEVKKIKRIIFETRAIVADHLESHMPQVTGKPEQVMDIEDIAEKVMQMINRRLKIEAERRGIF
jgi:hypothetical protein